MVDGILTREERDLALKCMEKALAKGAEKGIRKASGAYGSVISVNFMWSCLLGYYLFIAANIGIIY